MQHASFPAFWILIAVLAALGVVIGIAINRRRAARAEMTPRRSGSPAPWILLFLGLGVFLLIALFFLSARVERREEGVLRQQATPRVSIARPGDARRVEYRVLDGNTPSLPDETPAPAEDSVPETPSTVPAAPPTVADEYAAWEKADAMDPNAGASPPFVREGARCQPFSLVIAGKEVKGRHPTARGTIVGYSGLEPDGVTAWASARGSAERQVKSLLIWELKDAGGDQLRHIEAALSRLEPTIQAYVQDHAADNFEQTIKSNYGNVTYFRAATGVDVTKPKIEPLVAKLKEQIRKEQIAAISMRHKIIWTAASALGLALVIFLLYSFLNAGTKGYFAWPLRILSVGILVVLYVGIMYLQGWIPG